MCSCCCRGLALGVGVCGVNGATLLILQLLTVYLVDHFMYFFYRGYHNQSEQRSETIQLRHP